MKEKKFEKLENIISKEYSNIVGMVIIKDNKTIYEKYFNNCSADNRIHIFSITKSILSILFGIALDKGYIKSVDQKILEFFPEYTVKKGEKTIQNITIKDMLTMTAPYKYLFAPYKKYFISTDWVKFSLNLIGGKGKIGKFRYAPLIGPDILSGILERTTGLTVLEFAKNNLFLPLGICVEKDIVFHNKEEQMRFNKSTKYNGWVADPKGVNTGAWGLTLSPMDMAKIGQMLLNGGVWNGRTIVSKEWITESTSEHSTWKQKKLSYGYLWWISNDEESGFAAMGDGGNILYVNTKRNMVVAITSVFVPRAKDRIAFIKKYIENDEFTI
ncbi:MAG: serine hydrolase [Lachnospiraceae bacterium]|nr:serine hydrolase [Lachnospiraceae bacterium]